MADTQPAQEQQDKSQTPTATEQQDKPQTPTAAEQQDQSQMPTDEEQQDQPQMPTAEEQQYQEQMPATAEQQDQEQMLSGEGKVDGNAQEDGAEETESQAVEEQKEDEEPQPDAQESLRDEQEEVVAAQEAETTLKVEEAPEPMQAAVAEKEKEDGSTILDQMQPKNAEKEEAQQQQQETEIEEAEHQGEAQDLEDSLDQLAAEEESQEKQLEDSLETPALVRRPSLVTGTEIATSPGGTRQVSVDLKAKEPISLAETPPKKEENKKEKKKASVEPRMNDVVVTNEINEMDALNWKQHVQPASKEEEVLAAQLAADMERAKQREEREIYAAETVEDYEDIINASGKGKRKNASIKKAAALEQSAHDDALTMDEKDRQIEALQEQLMQALRGDTGVIDEVAVTDANVDKRDAKIVQLAKKNRNLQLALEKEKGLVTKLKSKVSELERTNSTNAVQSKIEKHQATSQAKDEEMARMEQQIRRRIESEFHDRLSGMQAKVQEARLKHDMAITEAKRVKRLLAREVGEGPVLDKLLSDAGAANDDDSSSWRGRAQKIVLLKDKLRRAHAQIEAMQQQSNKFPANGLDSESCMQDLDSVFDDEMRGNRHARKPKRQDIDSKAEDDIRNIEQERRHAMEKLTEEYEQMENELGEAKRMIGAVKARSKVLENENKRYKEQVKILLNKTNNDDTLVDALRRELERVKRECSEYKDRTKNLERGTTSTVAFDELKQHAMHQSAQIERQGQLLVRMRAEMERVKENASRDIVTKAHEDLDAHGYAVSNKLLKVENERLTELVDLFKKKLEKAVVDREAILSKFKNLVRSKVELERQLGNIRQGGRKRQPMADQFTQVRDKLALQIEENRALRASAHATISQKDEEIKILREMGIEIKRAYEHALAEMKRQVQQTALDAQKRIGHSETKVDDALLSQLTRDNEYLREELHDIRNRVVGSGLSTSPIHSRSTGALESPQIRNRKIGHRGV